jgi:hypothetical protein
VWQFGNVRRRRARGLEPPDEPTGDGRCGRRRAFGPSSARQVSCVKYPLAEIDPLLRFSSWAGRPRPLPCGHPGRVAWPQSPASGRLKLAECPLSTKQAPRSPSATLSARPPTTASRGASAGCARASGATNRAARCAPMTGCLATTVTSACWSCWCATAPCACRTTALHLTALHLQVRYERLELLTSPQIRRLLLDKWCAAAHPHAPPPHPPPRATRCRPFRCLPLHTGTGRHCCARWVYWSELGEMVLTLGLLALTLLFTMQEGQSYTFHPALAPDATARDRTSVLDEQFRCAGYPPPQKKLRPVATAFTATAIRRRPAPQVRLHARRAEDVGRLQRRPPLRARPRPRR